MGVAVYVDADFKAAFPEFAATPEANLAAKFGLAGMYLNNTDQSFVQDVPTRTNLLYMITAHLAKLDPALAALGGYSAQEVVGRISNATQGNVSVATEYTTQSQSQSFWVQTQYGAQFWASTAFLRSAQYRPAPRRCMGVPGTPGWGRWQ